MCNTPDVFRSSSTHRTHDSRDWTQDSPILNTIQMSSSTIDLHYDWAKALEGISFCVTPPFAQSWTSPATNILESRYALWYLICARHSWAHLRLPLPLDWGLTFEESSLCLWHFGNQEQSHHQHSDVAPDDDLLNSMQHLQIICDQSDCALYFREVRHPCKTHARSSS